VVIGVETGGGFARTETELALHNPNAQTLGGTLECSLRAGQEATGVALGFGGSWRGAVPKVLGRQGFEDEDFGDVRRRKQGRPGAGRAAARQQRVGAGVSGTGAGRPETSAADA
jgi:hypothetical protein